FLPSWLLGFGIQWQVIRLPPTSQANYPLPIAFLSNHFISVGNLGIPAQGSMYLMPISRDQVRVQHTYTSEQSGYIFSVGIKVMQRLYSPSTGSTYFRGVHSDIPIDALPISEKRYEEVI